MGDALIPPPGREPAQPMIGRSPPKPVRTPEEVEAMPPGAEFRTPSGEVMTRPYDVSDDESFQAVPLGAPYREGGKVQTKYAGEALDPRAQALYSAAHTTEGKKHALERYYPGKVKEERGELYIDQDGKRLSPKATSIAALAGEAAGAAAPTAGAVGGGIVGALVGPFTSMAGAGAGAAGGEALNQMILRILGIEDIPSAEGKAQMGTEFVGGIAGQAAGLSAPVIPSALRVGRNALANSPDLLRKFVGLGDEVSGSLRSVAERGHRVDPTPYMRGTPFPSKMMALAQTYKLDPVREGSGSAFSKTVGDAPGARTTVPPELRSLLTNLGASPGESEVVGRSSAPSATAAGEKVLGRVRAEADEAKAAVRERLAAIDAQMEALTAGKTTAEGGQASQRAALERASADLRQAAAKLVDKDIATLRATADESLAKVGDNPGDLARKYGEQIWENRRENGQAFTKMYQSALALGDGETPNIAPVSRIAGLFVDDINPAVREMYPREHSIIARLAGYPEMVKEGEEAAAVTLADLHELRTFLRSRIDWNDLTRTPSQGMLVALQGALDKAINDAGATPGLKLAAAALKDVDTAYGAMIRKYEDETVRQMSKFSRAGAAVDADKLAEIAFQPGNTERIRLVKQLGTPQLVEALEAADLKRMLVKAGENTGSVSSKAIADEIETRLKSGVLSEIHGPEKAEKLKLLLDRIRRSYGDDPLQVRPKDTVFSLMERADAAATALDNLSPKQLIATYEQQMAAYKRAYRETEREGARAAASPAENPLNTLRNTGAEGVIHKILDSDASPTLLRAIYDRFGEGEEIQAIRVYATRRWLQSVADKAFPGTAGGGSPEAALNWFTKLPEDVQPILFPGGTQAQAKKLVETVKMILPREMEDLGMSFMGASSVIHPERSPALGRAGRMIAAWPGFLGRSLVGAVLDNISDIMTHPQTIKFITSGLDSTVVAEREAATKALRDIIKHSFQTVASKQAPALAGVGAAGAKAGWGSVDDAPPEGEAPPEPMAGGPAWRQPSETGTPAWRQ